MKRNISPFRTIYSLYVEDFVFYTRVAQQQACTERSNLWVLPEFRIASSLLKTQRRSFEFTFLCHFILHNHLESRLSLLDYHHPLFFSKCPGSEERNPQSPISRLKTPPATDQPPPHQEIHRACGISVSFVLAYSLFVFCGQRALLCLKVLEFHNQSKPP